MNLTAHARPAAVKAVVAGSANPPACARLGALDEARANFRERAWAAAWGAAITAIQQRPFHPEAFLLLAEIALASGNSAAARLCAQLARDLAPGWKAAKQFLQRLPNQDLQPDRPTHTESTCWLSAIGYRLSHPARLTVCVIAKNEEQFLERCLESVRAIADQLIVVDTGSTDRTVEIARANRAEVFAFEWCDDFSAARNAALEHATGDWVLMIDADEELPADQHARLRADMQPTAAIAYRLPIASAGEAGDINYVPRLFRNAPGVFYRGRIHEQVFPSLLPHGKSFGLEIRLGSAQLLHHGYAKDIVRDRNKIERNLRLLRQAVAEQPGDPNLLLNLGLELVRSGQLTEGLDRYREAYRFLSAQTPANVVPELREVLLTQFTCHLLKTREFEEIVRVLNSPLAKNGGLTASLNFALGLAHYELKQYREAAEQMRRCITGRKARALSPINTDILTAAPNHCLALSLAQIGDAAAAESAFEAALAETGRTHEVRWDYAKFLARHRPVDALQQLHRIISEDSQQSAAWRLGGEIALSRPEFLEFAGDWTGEAIRCLPDDSEILAQRAEALLLSGQTATAKTLWERACERARSPRALAALVLCSVVESQPVPQTRDATEETSASRAFVEWYQRLLSAGARETVLQLNTRVDAFRLSLPTGARLLEEAIAEVENSQREDRARRPAPAEKS